MTGMGEFSVKPLAFQGCCWHCQRRTGVLQDCASTWVRR